MDYIATTFLGKEYTIPKDVLIYIDLLDFTESVKNQLVDAFVRKLGSEIQIGNIACLDDEALAAEIEQQIGRFISKLCDNGIYTRTISDYLKDNKGYQLFSEVNKAALEKMKSLLIKEMDSWQAGFEDAMHKRESSVTGLGFSVWSSSFVNHAIYAAMEASKVSQQEKEAVTQYQKDMDDLRARLESQYGGEKSSYVHNVYIPHMETALTVFAYELLDRYVADLIANNRFDVKALDYVDIGRSNDLLKNLPLSNNKRAILENAFAACPYNIAVYMQALKHDLLDYDSFQTAKVFKQDKLILSFLQESWGEVSFPTAFNINYNCINIWASLTDQSSADLLHGLTAQYAAGISEAYFRVASMMTDKANCHRIVAEMNEDALLLGESVSRGKAQKCVGAIVSAAIWEQLTERCGHTDLLSQIKKYFPTTEELRTKKEVDGYIIEQLTSEFEEIRKELVEHINVRRAEEERQRIAQERERAEQIRIQAEKKAKRTAAIKKGVKGTLIVVGGIVVACIALIIAGIVFLFATDKPVDDDFAQNYEESLHGLTYYVPENWEYSPDESSDNEVLYARFDNWGNFLGAMVATYEGESPDVTVDDVVAEFQDECSTATARTENINGQEFKIVTFELESSDATPFFYHIYVTEKNYSVYYFSFIFIEKSNKTDVFNEIVGAIAFDEYVNPKEEAYNDAVGLMATQNYSDAVSLFAELGGYRDSALKKEECEYAIIEAKYIEATRLMSDGKYEQAITILESLNGYKDSASQIAECNTAIMEENYYNAVALIREGSYEDAYDILVQLKSFPAAVQMLTRFRWVPTESTYVPTKSSAGSSYHSYTYNDNGILVEEVINDSTVVTYSYNSSGNIVLKKYTYSDGDTSKYEYKYNASDQLVQERYTYPDGSVDSVNYTYDSNGRISEAEDIHWGNFNQRLTYSYDSTGKLIKRDAVDHFGSLGCYEYVYDEHGRLIKEIHTSDIGKSYSVVYTTEYSYSTDGYLIGIYEYKDDRKTGCHLFSEWIVFYSSKGFPAQQ